MLGVGAEAHVAHDQKFGEGGAKRSHCLDNRGIVCVRECRRRVLAFGGLEGERVRKACE